MGEAEEVERGAMRSRVLGALRPLEAEVDEARLVGMEREPIPGKTLAQYSQDPRGIGKGLESHHEIVGVPDKAGSPLQAWSDRVFEPHIQHMVQVDVRKARGDHTTVLHGSVSGRSEPTLVWVQAMRTDFGRPSSSMRFRTATPTFISVA